MIKLSELYNYTFTNDPPFDVLGIPECGQQVENLIKTFFPSSLSVVKIYFEV
jgi:hypothetical protein